MTPNRKQIDPDGTYQLANPVELPDVLDMLVVGGGPAGTAAAFRAKETGLSALVIDFDDLLKRIRDYAKNKPILPSFGGGDRMKFPAGGELVEKLHFDPIDKDDMCAEWQGHYRAGCVPARVGIELTGLERSLPDHWTVRTWNHRLQEEETYRARHVVIAIGRGVPRRFDIPGNTDGVSYRLDDADNYVGAPVCVVGGGTSAAEAVIAISNAKAESEDPTPVYWSYRGERMPRVSRALSQVFFDAYVGNGNIRYYPKSEPVAVFTSPDKRDFLSLRVDRRSIDGRPHETTHLEFEKRYCIACIGEDLPESFLGTLGIELMTGGPRGRKRVVVSPLLESQQPNVYLVGDILSQAYLETDDFEADPATFREVKHPGNVKSALRDGVFVTEVIRQKLAGNSEIRVALEFVDREEAGTAGSAPVAAPLPEPEGPPAESVPDDRRVQSDPAEIVHMTAAGVDEEIRSLQPGTEMSVGRVSADLTFADDDSLSDRHATFLTRDGKIFVRDEASVTGTFYRLIPGNPTPIQNGDLLRLGSQFLLVGAEGDSTFVKHYNAEGSEVAQHPLTDGRTLVLGRQSPDVTLAEDDMVLSRRHLSLSLRGGIVYAKDLKSLNHTFLRVTGERAIQDGDVIRAGRQSFRLSLMPLAQEEVKAFTPPAAPSRVTAAVGEEAGPSVTFKGRGQTVEVPSRKSICDAAESAGITLNAECHAGVCGSDPIRIVSGGEHLNKIGDEESDTLEDICELNAGNDPGGCRLACMTRVTGPVVVEIIAQD